MRSWRKVRGPTISGTVEVTTDADFEVEVSELTDDELNYCIDEARKRGLLGAAKLGSRRDRLALVYEDLVAHRTSRALPNFERAMFGDEDGGLFDCWMALRDGRWNDAICWIDSEVFKNGAPIFKPEPKPQLPQATSS